MNVFDLALRVKLHPADNLHLKRLLELLNVSSVKSLKDVVSILDDDNYKKILKLVIDLNDDGSNLKISLNKYSDYIEMNSLITDDFDKKMILDEIKEIQKHWTQYARKTEKQSLNQFKNAMALGQTHPLTIKKGITLSTVHTMKGQEYEIVFLMGMDDGTFPDYRAIKTGGVDMIQEKNNTYVAFTRARRFLFVTYPEQRLMPWGDVKARVISRFLKDIK